VRLISGAIVLTAALAVQTAPPAPAGAPVLGVSGAQFTVNGAPKFLLFVSYFDALRRANHGGTNAGDLDTDFKYIKSRGFDGIRIFPNWHHYLSGARADDDGLFTNRGSIRAGMWPVFLRVLERAAANGLLVDVSFSRETISNLSNEHYGAQLRSVTAALAGNYPNVLFDLQNEFPIHSSKAEIETLLTSYVRPADPRRIVTASLDSGSIPDPAQAGRLAAELGLAVVAYHDARDLDTWFTEAHVNGVIAALKRGLGPSERPIYLQEPVPVATLCPPRCEPRDWDHAPLHAREAAAAAKRAGAAAWTFHTRSTFDLADRTFRARLDADPKQKAAFEAFQDLAGVPVEKD
jgi:hypothetical protein